MFYLSVKTNNAKEEFVAEYKTLAEAKLALKKECEMPFVIYEGEKFAMFKRGVQGDMFNQEHWTIEIVEVKEE